MATANHQWPPQTVLDVQERLKDHLRALADLSAYLGDGDATRIVLKDFSAKPACSTQPKPTLANERVADDRLMRAQVATEVMSQAFETFEPVPYGVEMAACVTENGQPDVAAQNAAAQVGPNMLENAELRQRELVSGRLPRLTKDQIQLLIAELLSAGGELGACFTDAGDGQTARIKADPAAAIAPVPLGGPVSKNTLGLLAIALRQLNSRLPLEPGSAVVFDQEPGDTQTKGA